MAAVVLVLTLKTRTEQNVNLEALKSFEESGDFGGLITSSVPRQLFELIVKHYAFMIKNDFLDQKDAL